MNLVSFGDFLKPSGWVLYALSRTDRSGYACVSDFKGKAFGFVLLSLVLMVRWLNRLYYAEVHFFHTSLRGPLFF